MVHGVFFRDFRCLNYWGRIPKELRRNGATVYYGQQRAPKDRPAIQETIFRNIGTQYVQPEKLEQDGGRGGYAEQPQQLTALRQPLDALSGAGLRNRPEIHPGTA